MQDLLVPTFGTLSSFRVPCPVVGTSFPYLAPCPHIWDLVPTFGTLSPYLVPFPHLCFRFCLEQWIWRFLFLVVDDHPVFSCDLEVGMAHEAHQLLSYPRCSPLLVLWRWRLEKNLTTTGGGGDFRGTLILRGKFRVSNGSRNFPREIRGPPRMSCTPAVHAGHSTLHQGALRKFPQRICLGTKSPPPL